MMERKPVGITAPYRHPTPEDDEFNRIERESRIKQDYVRDIKLPTREQLVAEVAILTELVKVLSARVDELEGKQ
jgi:sensor domain CHASE-containing protein